jgi:hypothetical protein
MDYFTNKADNFVRRLVGDQFILNNQEIHFFENEFSKKCPSEYKSFE